MACNTPDYRYTTQPVIVTDPDGGQAGVSAFGEQRTSELHPNVQLQFPYNAVNTDFIHPHENQSGTVTAASGIMTCASGASANSSAEMESKAYSKYRTGQGGIFRAAGFFTTGVAGNEQLIGIGNSEDGFFFGYNGATFGLLRRAAGAREIRTLTVTTKSTTAENITITLNSVAETTVAVTDATATDLTTTVNEIAAHDYSDVGDGWDAYASGNKVIFVSWRAEPKTGTYTLSGASTAVGTFAQSVAGVAPTDTWVAQSAWSEDVMDGTGSSGVTLDPTKGNVYQIQYQWLGFGMIKYHIENPATGNFVCVHKVQYANNATTPSIRNPTLPLYVCSINTTNTSNISTKCSSMLAGGQGKKTRAGVVHGAANRKSPGTATETLVLGIRNKVVYGGSVNRVEVKVDFMSAGVTHNKPCTINFWGNPTILGASWSDVHGVTSCMEKTTAGTTISGGDLLFSLSLGSEGNDTIVLPEEGLGGTMRPGDIIVATVVPESGTTHSASVSFNWTEDF